MSVIRELTNVLDWFHKISSEKKYSAFIVIYVFADAPQALIKGYTKVNNLEKNDGDLWENGITANQTIIPKIMDAHAKNREMESCGFPPDRKAKNRIFCFGLVYLYFGLI